MILNKKALCHNKNQKDYNNNLETYHFNFRQEHFPAFHLVVDFQLLKLQSAYICEAINNIKKKKMNIIPKNKEDKA